MMKTTERTLNPAGRLKSQLAAVYRRREFGVFMVVIIFMIIVGLRNPTFFTRDNWKDMLMYVSILAFISIGQMITIITGGIDLSVGSVLALSGNAVGIIMREYPVVHPVVLVFIGLMIGLGCGLINGVIIGKGKVPPLITTLATLSIYRGLVVVVSRSRWVVYSEITDGFKLIARGKILGVNNLMFVAMVIALVAYYFLNYTRKGREIYAYGDHHEAAKFVGIKGDNINMLVYSISGMLAGLGGVLWVSRVLTAQANTAIGYEMQTVASCVIGGVSIFGGVGSVMGVLLGTLLFGVILNSLELIGIVDFWKLSVQGFVILIAVIFDAILSHRVTEQMRKQRRVFNVKK
jgi:rhamnose transport system permease protein